MTDATEPDESVKQFVESYLAPGSDRIALDALWREYKARSGQVRKEEFRWNVEESLPPVATWTTSREVVGVEWTGGEELPSAPKRETEPDDIETNGPLSVGHSLKWRVTPGLEK
ncbi:hypothetical protein [Halomicrobium salinisoli]|uniref:hypothetical protein n=1 Tax=Halomicrobium salinisoli TaxID=2878391 RepID=UPI001CF0CA40|nr:hypothetical protein [Halomicrobium salinisoli]